MVKIEQDYGGRIIAGSSGFKVSFTPNRYKVHAKDLKEVNESISHYFYGHSTPRKECPVCRDGH